MNLYDKILSTQTWQHRKHGETSTTWWCSWRWERYKCSSTCARYIEYVFSLESLSKLSSVNAIINTFHSITLREGSYAIWFFDSRRADCKWRSNGWTLRFSAAKIHSATAAIRSRFPQTTWIRQHQRRRFVDTAIVRFADPDCRRHRNRNRNYLPRCTVHSDGVFVCVADGKNNCVPYVLASLGIRAHIADTAISCTNVQTYYERARLLGGFPYQWSAFRSCVYKQKNHTRTRPEEQVRRWLHMCASYIAYDISVCLCVCVCERTHCAPKVVTTTVVVVQSVVRANLIE